MRKNLDIENFIKTKWSSFFSLNEAKTFKNHSCGSKSKTELIKNEIRSLTRENQNDFSLPNDEISSKILKSISEIHGFRNLEKMKVPARFLRRHLSLCKIKQNAGRFKSDIRPQDYDLAELQTIDSRVKEHLTLVKFTKECKKLKCEEDDHCYLVFFTPNIKKIANCARLAIDATFPHKRADKYYHQVLILVCDDGDDKNILLGGCAMPHKLEACYDHFFEFLKSYIECDPFAKIISVDHEVALRNSVKKHIKYDTILLCRYHTGAILKKDIEKVLKPELAAVRQAENDKKKITCQSLLQLQKTNRVLRVCSFLPVKVAQKAIFLLKNEISNCGKKYMAMHLKGILDKWYRMYEKRGELLSWSDVMIEYKSYIDTSNNKCELTNSLLSRNLKFENSKLKLVRSCDVTCNLLIWAAKKYCKQSLLSKEKRYEKSRAQYERDAYAFIAWAGQIDPENEKQMEDLINENIPISFPLL